MLLFPKICPNCILFMKLSIFKANIRESRVPLVKAFVFSTLIIIFSLICAALISSLETRYNIIHLKTPLNIGLGIMLLCLGFLFRVSGSFLFYKKHIEVIHLNPQWVLIQSGVYSFTRNPLYIGLVLIALGSGLVFGSLITVVCSLFFAVFWHMYVVNLEEPRLEKLFGVSYREYKAKIPRWL